MREHPVFEQALKHRGRRAAYTHASFYFELEPTTPRHGDRPFDIGHIDDATCTPRSRSGPLPAGQVERARAILLAAADMQDLEIAADIGIGNQKAARWRKRFLKIGLAGLEKDAPRPGRTPTITSAKMQEVIRRTRKKPSNETHWSTRTLAETAGLSEKSVRRIWRKHGLKPHLFRTFKVSNDPQSAEKLEAIVGLYLNPPEHAIVLCAPTMRARERN